MIGFVHIPKTAGTTVKFVLRNSFGLRHCDVRTADADGVFKDAELRFARRVFLLPLRCISGHGLVHPTGNLSGDIRYFTFLREPLARSASQWQHVVRGKRRRPGVGKPASFEAFMANEANHDVQVKWIAGRPDVEAAKREIRGGYFFVGLAERFDESLAVFQRLCPYPVDIRHHTRNVAPDSSIKKELLADPGRRAILEEANRLDTELYEWVRDELYPEQLERAGLEAEAQVEIDPTPPSWRRYNLTRMYNNGIYRQLVKARRMLVARSS